MARQQPATGVRDRLRADALALAVDGQPAKVLVAVEACALGEDLVRRIAGACPVPDGDVVVTCSHTHAAPAAYRLLGCGDPDPEYGRRLALCAGDAARRALADLVPCRLGWGRRALPAPPWGNRRAAAGPLDPRVHLLKIERAESDRTPVCALWSVACHPVVLGADNRLVSADFVGEVRSALPFPATFVQGCCGDQNPLARGEAGLAAWGGVAAAVRDLWGVTPTAPAGRWAWAARAVTLPRLPGDGTARLPAGGANVERAMAEWVRTRARPGEPVPPETVHLTAAAVGNGRIAFWPGEPFASLQLALPGDVLAVGHAGATVGYVPDRQAYDRPGYEAGSAHYFYGYPSALAPEAGERLVATTADLLRDVR